jgi:hypothetical protein
MRRFQVRKNALCFSEASLTLITNFSKQIIYAGQSYYKWSQTSSYIIIIIIIVSSSSSSSSSTVSAS